MFGEIVAMAVKEDFFDEQKLRMPVKRVEPYGGLGGPTYCRTSVRMKLSVPTCMPSVGVAHE